MTNSHDFLRNLIRQHVASPEPASEQVASARRALADAMADSAPSKGPVLPRLATAVAAFVLAVAAVITVVTPWSGTPADALLTELAFATRDITPQELPEGSYVYVSSEELAFGDAAAEVDGEFVYVQLLIPIQREAWWQGDTVQVETTVDRPIFFNREDEAFYYANDLDKADFVGETRTQFLTGIENQPNLDEWSTDPTELAGQIQTAAELTTSGDEVRIRMVELAEQLLVPQLVAPPALRGAILEVLAALDLDQQLLEDGSVVASLTYDQPGLGTVTKQLVFDAEGYLVGREITTLTGDETGLLPPGTVFDRVERTPPIVVSGPGIAP